MDCNAGLTIRESQQVMMKMPWSLAFDVYMFCLKLLQVLRLPLPNKRDQTERVVLAMISCCGPKGLHRLPNPSNTLNEVDP